MKETSWSMGKNLMIVFLFLILFKGVGLWLYGPIMTPDSSGYTAYADLILRSRDWLTQKDLTGSVLGFRSIGYPMVIAGAKLVGGEAWMWFVVGFQLIFSMIASFYIFRLAKHLSGRNGVGLFAGLSHGVGQTVVLDQCILTDSLNASLLVILSCHVGLSILQRRKPSLWEVGSLGVVVVLAFLIREVGSFLQYLYWPLIAYWGFVVGESKVRMITMTLVFAAPMLAGTQAYKSWNEHRTGQRFITTASQTTMFFPALGLEQRGIHVFSDDDLLKDMEPFGPWDSTTRLEQVKRISRHLSSIHKFSSVDIARYSMSMFLRLWLTHPVAMIKLTFSQVRGKQSVLAFMPLESFVQLGFWATGERPWPKKRTLLKSLSDGENLDKVALVFARGAFRGVAMLITLGFLVGVPFFFIREIKSYGRSLQHYNSGISLMFLYWLLYFGYTSAYAMVHLEIRYLMPVEPLSMVTGLVVLATLWQNYVQKRAIK